MAVGRIGTGTRSAFTLAVSALGVSSPVSAQVGSVATVAAQANNPGEDRDAALACLTEAIVYEAAHEPLEGREAVAQVIVNRTRAGRYPASICGVINQGGTRRTGCQFSYVCDGSRRRQMPQHYFDAARPIAQAALDGTLADRVGNALFYHANYVSPRWAPSLDRIGQIGLHIFYTDAGRRGHVRMTSALAPATSAGARSADNRPFAPWGLPIAVNSAQN